MNRKTTTKGDDMEGRKITQGIAAADGKGRNVLSVQDWERAKELYSEHLATLPLSAASLKIIVRKAAEQIEQPPRKSRKL
ncbi:hypothetical protein ACXZ1M_20355 [Duganella sp. PWIR1]